MNFKDKCSIKIVNLPKEEPPQRVTKGHNIVVHLDSSQSSPVDGTRLANHKAKKSNNSQNSGLCHYVISVRKTSAIHMKIIISTPDNYYHRRRGTHLQSLITASYYYVFYVQ